jgi:hypothetical protein
MSAEETIERRQDRAYRAALAYSDGEDIGVALTDLITDLLHLADQYAGSEDHLKRALERYQSEGEQDESES